ncbi:MurR/RpiR family transcriptional regulator [Rhodococcus sp. AG1013]|uniref:MurR/RpiR family transcriptional regulator n=1 Tax=unclassified Rhodococcus (in: high G+C Gram-positive bacteria) TaxID=192944 RepID=UPI000E0A785E|nr:MurR/RpiR family transcriptional regulator [Rhodococcus sp. AG1013]RDI16116.1 RpiR family transcriptional regulator [Rhodococcus sp. AG1013]
MSAGSPESESASGTQFPIGTTTATIRAMAAGLAPSERRVADVCVERPREVAWWSAADLAEAASTSTATVVRACQNLGFTGFQHVRMLLLRDLGAETSTTPQDASPPGSIGVLQAIVSEVGSDLSGGLAPLSEKSFDDTVRVLANARRIFVVANGGSAPAAAAFAVRMLVNGRIAEAPTDTVVQLFAARTLTADDVCVAVSDSGMNAYTIDVTRAARAAGAYVVGVTGHARSTLVELSDSALVIGNGSGPYAGHGVSATIIQLTFLLGLQVAVSEVDGATTDAATKSLEHFAALMNPPIIENEPTDRI